jgi:hypothetical protein
MAPTVASPSLAPTVYGPAVAAASFRMMATDQRRSAGGGAYITASSVSARGACAVGAAASVASPHVEQKMLRPMMPSITGFACAGFACARHASPVPGAGRACAARGGCKRGNAEAIKVAVACPNTTAPSAIPARSTTHRCLRSISIALSSTR